MTQVNAEEFLAKFVSVVVLQLIFCVACYGEVKSVNKARVRYYCCCCCVIYFPGCLSCAIGITYAISSTILFRMSGRRPPASFGNRCTPTAMPSKCKWTLELLFKMFINLWSVQPYRHTTGGLKYNPGLENKSLLVYLFLHVNSVVQTLTPPYSWSIVVVCFRLLLIVLVYA